MEPPYFYYPVCQSLGEALLEAGRHREAESVYRKALDAFPQNGWSLFGLYQSLEQQQRYEEAQGVYRDFEKAWSEANAEMKGSGM